MSGGSEERQRGVALFKGTWELIESREDDDRMLHMAHAQRFEWGEAPECGPENVARGEWLVSRVYCSSGARSLRSSTRSAASRRAKGPVSPTGISHTRTRRWRGAAGDAIAEADDREQFERDFATL